MPLTSNLGIKSVDGGGGGIALNGIEESHTIASDETISAGDFVSFDDSDNVTSLVELFGETDWSSLSYGTEYTQSSGVEQSPYHLEKISDTKQLLVYTEGTTAYAVIVTITGSVVSYGTPTEIGMSYGLDAVLLTSTLGVCTYRDVPNADKGTAVAFSISGDTITAGTSYVFDAGLIPYTSVTRLSDTKAIVSYVYNVNNGRAVVLSLSGTTVSSGSYVNYSTATLTPDVEMISSTKAITIYEDDASSDYTTAQILNISGTTVTTGTEYRLYSSSSGKTGIKKISDTVFAVTYETAVLDSYVGICTVDAVNDVIYMGLTTLLNDGNQLGYGTQFFKLDDNTGIVTYTDFTNGYYGSYQIAEIYGGKILLGSKVAFSGTDSVGSFEYIRVEKFDTNKALLTYKNVTDNELKSSILTGTLGTSLGYDIDGVAKENGSGGDSIIVIVPST